MNSTEKQCVKSIASFNMFDSSIIITYTDGSQTTQKVDFKKIRNERSSEQAKNRRTFAKKYADIRVSESMLRLFDLIVFGGYHCSNATLKELRNNQKYWLDIKTKYTEAHSEYRKLKAQKVLKKLDCLVNAIVPGWEIGSLEKDWKFPNGVDFSAPVGNKELAKKLIEKNILPSNFFIS